MGAHVIQHTEPRRKRANAWSWTTRHVLLLGVVIIAIIVASSLAPELSAPSRPAQSGAASSVTAAPAPAPPNGIEAEVAAEFAQPRPVARRREPARQTGIPLDAAVTPADEYEILSAAELDAISQARK